MSVSETQPFYSYRTLKTNLLSEIEREDWHMIWFTWRERGREGERRKKERKEKERDRPRLTETESRITVTRGRGTLNR